MTRLAVLRDIDSDKLWLSPEINHGDWPFRFAVRLMYTDYWDSEWSKQVGKYHIEVLAVSPTAASREMNSALKSCGMESQGEVTELMKYEVLIDYGVYATLFQADGNNQGKLEREARQKIQELGITFGFAMDRQQNAIGATGWDFIAGDITCQYCSDDDTSAVSQSTPEVKA